MEGQYQIEWTEWTNGIKRVWRDETIFPHNASAALRMWNQKREHERRHASTPHYHIDAVLIRLDINQ